jgi:rubrerythrin
MDSALKALIGQVRAIRDQADSVLRKIEQPSGERSLAWKCTRCGHIKHFTRPALAEVAAPCPKCGGVTMESL